MKTNILYALGGFVVGAVAGGLVGKLYFEKKAEERANQKIEDMEHAMGVWDRYHRNEDVRSDDEDPERESGIVSGTAREAMKNTQRGPKTDVDYTKFYKGNDVDYVDEHEEEDPDDDLPENNTDPDDDAMVEEHIKNMGRPPRIISLEEMMGLNPHYGVETLFYYDGDDVVTDEEDNIIDEPALLLGNCLDKYDFRNSDEMEIYVLNYSLDKCYDVQKVPGYFGPIDPIIEALPADD